VSQWTGGWRAKATTFHSRLHPIRSYVTLYCAHRSTIEDITMILLHWMMWCILFYIGFVRDPASILVGFVGDLPSVILCKHDCRIVKTTHPATHRTQ